MLFEPANNSTENNTARKLGEEYRLSHSTISKYGAYSRAIDNLAKKNEELVPKILSGQTKISQDNLIELAKLTTQELRRLGKQLISNDRDFVSYATTRKKLKRRSRSPKKNAQASPEITIKDMPVFDPDADVSSLSLTIPSWISCIERTQKATNHNLVSEQAKNKLIKMLNNLKEASDQMLSIVKE